MKIPVRRSRAESRAQADADRRAILMVLAALGAHGATVSELDQHCRFASGIAEGRLRTLEARKLVRPHPEGRRRKVGGRWGLVWVRTDAMLDGLRRAQ